MHDVLASTFLGLLNCGKEGLATGDLKSYAGHALHLDVAAHISDLTGEEINVIYAKVVNPDRKAESLGGS